MHRITELFLLFVGSLSLFSCMDYGPIEEESFGYSSYDKGLFIVNEGNFMYGNGSLSYYDISSGKIENDIFSRSNGISLGDVAQSMTIYNGKGYIVVNNSGIVFVIDPNTFLVRSTITGLISPRYIHFVDNNKAYISDLYNSCLYILDVGTNKVTGQIHTKGHPSTEQFAQFGDTLFVNCWSYDNTILAINTKTDEIVDSIKVWSQPRYMLIDKNDKLWIMSEGSIIETGGNSMPKLTKIDARTLNIDKVFDLPNGHSPINMALNGNRDTLYYINKDIYKVAVNEDNMPSEPYIRNNGTIFYQLAVDAESSNLYVADAIDYVQSGVVFRFSADATPIDTFKVGIIPGAFCFK